MLKSESKAHKKFYNDAFSKIFSNPEFARSLLEDMIGEEWVGLINFSTRQVKPSTFLGISDDKKESDLLLKFSLKNQTNLLIYVLLEFQSTYQRMFFRLWEYLLRIYRIVPIDFATISFLLILLYYHGKQLTREVVLNEFRARL